MKTTSAAREQAIVIDCAGESLLGIVHHPPADAPETTQATGVVVVVVIRCAAAHFEWNLPRAKTVWKSDE